MKHSLIIGVYVTKNKEFIEQLENDSMLLLNYVESTLRDNPIETNMEKHKYEQLVSECKKLSSLINSCWEKHYYSFKKIIRYCSFLIWINC